MFYEVLSVLSCSACSWDCLYRLVVLATLHNWKGQVCFVLCWVFSGIECVSLLHKQELIIYKRKECPASIVSGISLCNIGY